MGFEGKGEAGKENRCATGLEGNTGKVLIMTDRVRSTLACSRGLHIMKWVSAYTALH